jgi:hypothetical protein
MSWINEEEELLEIQEHCDRIEIESIKSYFIYINQNGYIQSITTDNIELDYNREKNTSFINKNKILKIIQQQKINFKNSKYIYKDACLFLVNLEPEDIKEFSIYLDLKDYNNRFFKKIPLLEDVIVEPSIFLFHKLASIYFFFEEIEKDTVTPKPILKIQKNVINKTPSSKKVTIKINKRNKTTRKNIN